MNKSVMVVDDEHDTRDAIAHHLTRNGLEAVAAAGGVECLEYFKNGFHGVVLMDVHMPGMNGWETIQEIIKQGYGEKSVIVLLTADRSARIGKSKEFRQYVVEYIPKPVELKQLVEAVKNYLRYFD